MNTLKPVHIDQSLWHWKEKLLRLGSTGAAIPNFFFTSFVAKCGYFYEKKVLILHVQKRQIWIYCKQEAEREGTVPSIFPLIGKVFNINVYYVYNWYSIAVIWTSHKPHYKKEKR